METGGCEGTAGRCALQNSFSPRVRIALIAALALLVASLACSCARIRAVQQPTPAPAAGGDTYDPLAVLIAGLQSSDPIVQADAAWLLGELRSRDAVGPLVDYVCTDWHYGKTAGLEALARIGDPSVCPRIRELLSEPHVPDDTPWYGRQSVRVAAALALISLGDEAGAPALQEIISANPKPRSPEEAAQWALYAWFAPAVLDLQDSLEGAGKLKQEMTFERLFPEGRKDPGQIVVTVRALGMLKTDRSLGKLVELLKFHSRYVRASAAMNLLRASPTPGHIAAVAELAEKDPTEFVRVKASLALALAGDDKRLPTIVRAADSAEEGLVRAAAIEALGLLHQRPCVAVLMRQLRQPDPFVRLSAIGALDRLDCGETASLAVADRRQDDNPRVRLYAAKYFAARRGAPPRAIHEDRALKVGVASCDITPPQPTLLTAIGMDHIQPTLGALNSISARAIAFQAGGKVAFVVIGDQVFTGRDVQLGVSAAVAKQVGCDPQNVLIASTHNHSSTPRAADNSGDAGQKALAEAREKITDGYTQACLAACKNLRPAEMAAATAWLQDPVGVTRRMHAANGQVITNWTGGSVAVPGEKFCCTGPDSERIDILSIREPGHKEPFAILTSYASHIHLVGLPYFDSEFAGRARQEIEARMPGATAVYANGTAGDLTIKSPIPGPFGDIGSPETLQWYNDSMGILSRRFADAVIAAIPTDGYRRPETFDHEADMASFSQAQFQRGGAPASGNAPQPQVLLPRVNALTLDDVALVVIPGEMFNSFGEMMHAQSPLERLLLLGYGAGSMGYVPPVIGYEEGGYEPHGAEAQGTRGLDISKKAIEILDRLVTLADERDQQRESAAAPTAGAR
jgi:HEAT repeat protein